jgi:hypothetical protein
MSTEFITLDSRLTIRMNAITETKLKDITYTRSRYYFLSLALNAFCLYMVVAWQDYSEYVIIPVLLFMLMHDLQNTYIGMFKLSHKPTIFLKEVRDVTTTALNNGLETQVTLHLANGRKKFYVFRNAENQLDGFLQLFDFGGKAAMSLG